MNVSVEETGDKGSLGMGRRGNSNANRRNLGENGLSRGEEGNFQKKRAEGCRK